MAPVFDVPKVEKLVADGQSGDWGNRGFRVEVMREPSVESAAQ